MKWFYAQVTISSLLVFLLGFRLGLLLRSHSFLGYFVANLCIEIMFVWAVVMIRVAIRQVAARWRAQQERQRA